MTERSIFIKVAVKDADRAVAELNKLGLRGEKALGRVEKAAKPANRGLRALDRTAVGARGALGNLGSAVILLEGPLGGTAARFNSLNAAIGRFGVVGAAGIAAAAGLTAAFLSTTTAASRAEQRMFRVNAILEATGRASGLTAFEIDRFATELGNATLTSRNAVREAAGALLTFRSVGGEAFFETLTLAQDLAATFGGDLRANAIQLGKALEDPVTGLTSLRRVGVSFSESQKELIQDLAESGRLLEAQRVILDELGRQVGGAGAGEAQGLAGKVDTLAENWSLLNEQLGDTGLAKGALDLLNSALVNYRKNLAPTLEDQIALNRALVEGEFAQLTFIQRLTAPLRQGGAATRLADLEAELARQTTAAGAEKAQALAARERAAAERRKDALIRIEKEITKETLALTENRVRRIQEEGEKAIARLEALRTPETGGRVDELIARRQALTARQIAQATEAARKAAEARAAAEAQAAERIRAANDKIVEGFRVQALAARDLAAARGAEERAAVERRVSVETALRRLSAEATAAQRQEVARLAGALFDEKAALEAKAAAERRANQVAEEGRALTESLLTPIERYNAGLARTRDLLLDGAISAETARRNQIALNEEFRAADPELRRLDDAARAASETLAAGAIDATTGLRSLRDVLGEVERGLLDIGNALAKESLARFLSGGLFGGGFGFGGGTSLQAQARADIAANRDIFGGGSGGGLFDLFGSALASLFHGGGTAGRVAAPRQVPAAAALMAPRFQTGSIPGISPNELLAVLDKREIVLNPAQSDALRRRPAEGRPSVNMGGITVNILGGGGAGAEPDPGFTRDQVMSGVLDAFRRLEFAR
ncbi:MAG TPA: phage tail length tape measure family protein [Thermohalobaculum sp.]|nr:phage tail length tape measure family protein [Thermohalobaculum sp.]